MDTSSKKKNLFWILSGVAVFILLVGWLVGWWMITSSTEEQVATRDGVFSKVNNLQPGTIPNPEISKVLETKKQDLADGVFKIWEERFNAQQEHFKKTLTDKSASAVAILVGDQEISTLDLDQYKEIIQEEIANLNAVVNLRQAKVDPNAPKATDPNNGGGNTPTPGRGGRPDARQGPGSASSGGTGSASGAAVLGGDDTDGGSGAAAGNTGRGGRGGRGGGIQADDTVQQRIEYEGVVDWKDREQVLTRYLEWEGTPNKDQLNYALEYWAAMYSVLDVIGKTNGNVAHFEAPIKQIRALRIGRLGPQKEGGPKPEAQSGATTGDGNVQGGMPDARQGPSSAASGGGGGASGQSTGASLGVVNDGTGDSSNDGAVTIVNDKWGMDGFTLPTVSQQPKDITSLENGRYVDDNGYPIYSEANNPHVEFRMIPMYLEIVIDQSQIDRFFAFAAASPLPVEVQQICAIHGVSTEEKKTKGIVDYSPTDVVLKVRGVIYFYQKPVKENIGKKPSEVTPAQATGDSAKP